jgi:RND family efflux transporter MFP subunit
MRTLEDVVRAVGVLAVDETRVSTVTARFDGFVERLLVDFTGRSVREGEPLLEVYSAELLAAQEELLVAARLPSSIGQSAGAASATPADLAEAARRRLLLWAVAPQDVDELVADGRSRRALTLRSPASGVVLEKNVLRGDAITEGQVLYRIADLSRLWVEVDVREVDARLVRVGDSVTLEASALPGRSLSGRVEYVYPALDEQARTLRARVALPNPDGQLRIGMYMTVHIRAPGRSALTVPASAVLDTGERRLAFVDLGEGRILPVDVEVGRASGELVEIVFGLEPGQRVVTSAQFMLDGESNLAEVMRSMIGQMSTSDLGATEDMQDMPGMDAQPAPPGGR